MSKYEDYSVTSKSYDRTRIPAGIEITTGCLIQNTMPLSEQHVLDAGCGTGNYSEALLKYIGKISAVDLNEGMLNQAKDKLDFARQQGRIEFHHAPIDSLPFEDAQFDGIVINQVLHHLELAAKADYPVYRHVFAELFRVLKPNGSLIINTCSHEQLEKGFWYYNLFPEERQLMIDRHASLSAMQKIMNEAGINYQGSFVPMDTLMQGDSYFNARGPLDKSWRDGDSIWSTVPTEKIKTICLKLTELDQADQLEKFMIEKDKSRHHIGQLTFLHGRRDG